MSATAHTPGYSSPDESRKVFVKGRRKATMSPETREGLAVTALAFAAYAILGWRVVLEQNVVLFDAVARVAHAYFVWHNEPPKLAAVGFVWPPISTLVFLPFTIVKPLATSLIALPLTSALFAAGTVMLLNRVFALVEMPRRFRYPLIVLYAVNPMILFYATNGMSEAVYLFFLVWSVYALLRWFLTRQPRFLVLAGFAFAAGILSRYEMITWATLLTVVIAVAMMRQHVSRSELEGSLIAYLAPVSYGIGLWLFVNWLILGDPLFWLRYQAPGQAAEADRATVAPSTLDGMGAGEAFTSLLSLNWSLFPPTLLVLSALCLLFLVRRDLMALTLAGFIALNGFFTILLIAFSGNAGFLQLRYNMRAMPLALVGVAWLWLALSRREHRLALVAAAVVALVASLPSTWATMRTYPFQFMEQAFVAALATGADQEGTRSIGGYAIGVRPEQRMADYIRTNVARQDSILTDDAQSFAVMLLSGRPDLFVDRIDGGDDAWLDVRESPWGRVRYVLVSRIALNDLVLVRYPGLLRNEQPGFRSVFVSERWRLLAVARTRPRAPA